MQLALSQCKENIDLIILHAPGTVKGDAAEQNAIQTIYGTNTPLMWSNKWKIGHTLGASGAMSLECALHILEYQNIEKVSQLHGLPLASAEGRIKKPIRNILINAVGFGGNAVSIVVGI
jgi:3-oxoacyl-(acyl-carrier-protein) synthase